MCIPMNEIGVQFVQQYRAGRIHAAEQSSLVLQFKNPRKWSQRSGPWATLARPARHALPTKGETEQCAVAPEASARVGGA